MYNVGTFAQYFQIISLHFAVAETGTLVAGWRQPGGTGHPVSIHLRVSQCARTAQCIPAQPPGLRPRRCRSIQIQMIHLHSQAFFAQ